MAIDKKGLFSPKQMKKYSALGQKAVDATKTVNKRSTLKSLVGKAADKAKKVGKFAKAVGKEVKRSSSAAAKRYVESGKGNLNKFNQKRWAKDVTSDAKRWAKNEAADTKRWAKNAKADAVQYKRLTKAAAAESKRFNKGEVAKAKGYAKSVSKNAKLGRWIKLGRLGSMGVLGAATVAAASPALYGAHKYKKALGKEAESSKITGELADRRRKQIIENRKGK